MISFKQIVIGILFAIEAAKLMLDPAINLAAYKMGWDDMLKTYTREFLAVGLGAGSMFLCNVGLNRNPDGTPATVAYVPPDKSAKSPPNFPSA